MNTQILKKVIDALNEESPRLDYIKGMLETLYEMEVPATPLEIKPILAGATQAPKIGGVDEATILDGKTRALLDAVKHANVEN